MKFVGPDIVGFQSPTHCRMFVEDLKYISKFMTCVIEFEDELKEDDLKNLEIELYYGSFITGWEKIIINEPFLVKDDKVPQKTIKGKQIILKLRLKNVRKTEKKISKRTYYKFKFIYGNSWLETDPFEYSSKLRNDNSKKRKADGPVSDPVQALAQRMDERMTKLEKEVSELKIYCNDCKRTHHPHADIFERRHSLGSLEDALHQDPTDLTPHPPLFLNKCDHIL